MPGSTPATSQLDWLSSTTAMIVLSWSKATRDLLKSFSGGIRGTPSVICQRRWCHLLRRLPHTISPVEESGFEPLVPATWTTPARPSPGAHSRSGRRDQLVQRGDRRSHPLSSSGESRANLIPRGSVSNASCGSGCAPASFWQVHRPVAASYSMIFARSGNRLSLDSRRFLAMALAVAVGRRAPLKYHHRTSSDRAPRDGDRAAR